MSTDLLRAPPLPRQLDHDASQRVVGVDPAPVVAGPADGREPMRIERAVAVGAGVDTVDAALETTRRNCSTFKWRRHDRPLVRICPDDEAVQDFLLNLQRWSKQGEQRRYELVRPLFRLSLLSGSGAAQAR